MSRNEWRDDSWAVQLPLRITISDLKLSNPFHLWPWPGYSEASGIDQINLTSWLERLGQLNFHEINLEKMVFLSKRMSEPYQGHGLKKKKKSVPSLLNQFYFHFNCEFTKHFTATLDLFIWCFILYRIPSHVIKKKLFSFILRNNIWKWLQCSSSVWCSPVFLLLLLC